jgi:prepilin-type N-terminal cleavage/methylation domain-containing protein
MIEYIVNGKSPNGPHWDHIPGPSVKERMTQRSSGSLYLNLKDLQAFQFRNRQRGFTLVELLVVLTVFILLVGLTVPSYVATRPQRMLSGETNRVAAVIRQGRLFSLRDNQKAYMEFLPEIDTYRLWSGQGWRAYADPVMGPNDPPGRNPDIGDYDGDLDGDGDFWWGTGGTPSSPTGVPEDPDVINDPIQGWVYRDSDGTYLDPDVLLMPSYPGNRPIRTLSPKVKITIDTTDGSIQNIARDFSDTGGVAGDSIVPFEVDLRMRETAWDRTQPLGTRNGLLSHFPLLFLVFFPDGTTASSWDSVDSTDFSNEIIDLAPGRLGATQIFLQVRSEDYNPEAFNLFDPSLVVLGDEGVEEPLSPYDTLSLADSRSDSLGRTITLNNLSGRVIIRNFPPIDLDQLFVDFGINYY